MCCCCHCCCFSLDNTDSNEKVPRGSQSAAVLLKKVPHPLAFFFFLAALLAKGLTFQKMSHPVRFLFFLALSVNYKRGRGFMFLYQQGQIERNSSLQNVNCGVRVMVLSFQCHFYLCLVCFLGFCGVFCCFPAVFLHSSPA